MKSVLLTTEGTYPFHTGGVSTWCDNLIKGLDEFSFTLFAVMMNPYISYKYTLPANVSYVIRLPLWGVEEPSEYIREIHFSDVYRAKLRTTNQQIEKRFLPLLRRFLAGIQDSEKEAENAGEALYQMYLYFKENDYNEVFKSLLVWDCFCEEMLSFYASEERDRRERKEDPIKLYNLTESLRWLYRFLIVLVAEVPKTDLTHSAAAAFCSIPCIISKFKYGTPFLLTEHGVYIREQYIFVSKSENTYHSKKFLLNLITLISRMSYHYADEISPVCNYNTTWERAVGANKDKIKTMYNGVEPREFANLSTTGYRQHLVVVSVARVDPLKDIETLIKAASYVSAKIPDVKFIVYGTVHNLWYYEKCMELIHSFGLDDVFTFAGHTDDYNRIYGEGDLIVVSSMSEAFPYTVIEAMMAGKVVVSTDVGGIREALEGCGLLVKPKDPENLAKAIIQILENPELRKAMEEDSREKALNNFNIQLTIDQYRESYLKLMESYGK